MVETYIDLIVQFRFTYMFQDSRYNGCIYLFTCGIVYKQSLHIKYTSELISPFMLMNTFNTHIFLLVLPINMRFYIKLSKTILKKT